MARGKSSQAIVNTGDQTDGKTKRRMGGMGDAELADTLVGKLAALIRPISTRPRFKEVRSVLFSMMAELGTIAAEETATEE